VYTAVEKYSLIAVFRQLSRPAKKVYYLPNNLAGTIEKI